LDGASGLLIGYKKGQPSNWRRASIIRAISVEETGKGAVPAHDHDHSHGKEADGHAAGGDCCDDSEECCTNGEGGCCANK
jgi:hypothetical protein